MDHSHMDHSGMDHGDMDHGHGGGGMKDMCSMNVCKPCFPLERESIRMLTPPI